MVNRGSAERFGRAMAATIIFTALMGLWPAANHAQELEARTYSNAPVGLNFIGGAYVFSTGNVLVDPSLPVEGLESDLHLFALRYTRTIGFLGKNAKLKLVLPIATASFTGSLAGESRSRAIEGLGDARAIFELNFLGAPALEPREFGGYRQATIVGTSLAVILPTGQYDADKLLNLGTNRWGFRPEIGVSRAVGRWTLEATATVWLYTDNDDFFGGQLLDQDPLYALQGHVIFNLRPGFWLGFDIGYANGGTTTLDGVRSNTLQSNIRTGVTALYPLGSRHGVKLAFSTGASTRIGADFETFSIAYQYMWGNG